MGHVSQRQGASEAGLSYILSWPSSMQAARSQCAMSSGSVSVLAPLFFSPLSFFRRDAETPLDAVLFCAPSSTSF
jgi:hypothetical protein